MKLIKKFLSFIMRNLSTIFSGTVIIVIIALTFFYTFPFSVAVFKNINVNSDVKVGGILEYTNDYCQNVGKGVPRDIDRYLVPKDTKLVSPVQLSGNPTDETLNDAGCRISEPIKLPIDSSIPAGEYKLLVKVKYCVFPGRCIPVQGESDYFTITKPDVATQLQIIKNQLDSIDEALRIKTSETISNIQPTYTLPLPTPPVTDSQAETQPIAIPETPHATTQEQPRSILRGTTDVLKNITNMLGL